MGSLSLSSELHRDNETLNRLGASGGRVPPEPTSFGQTVIVRGTVNDGPISIGEALAR